MERPKSFLAQFGIMLKFWITTTIENVIKLGSKMAQPSQNVPDEFGREFEFLCDANICIVKSMFCSDIWH